jgi:outer membrane biosynthesis protein TonB
LIAASILFLAAAIATFLVGVFSSGLQMIGVSIGCSIAAAALLLVGVIRDSKRRPAVAPMGAGISQREVATYASPTFEEETPAEPPYETAAVGGTVEEDESTTDLFGAPAGTTYEYEPEPEPEPEFAPEPARPARRAPARAKSTAKTAAKTTKTAAKKAAPKKTAARGAKTAAKPAAKAAAKKTTAKSPAKKAAPNKAASRKAAPRRPSGS